MNITITESAKNKIIDILAEENNPNTHVRMFVQGGGCGGFQYGFTLDDIKNEDDWEVAMPISSVLVDSASAMYLEGAEVDYVESLMSSEFKINNPLAQSTCGCGSSFSIR